MKGLDTMKATIKLRAAKGILAAALAFATVLGVSQSAKSSNMLAAHAGSCSHNYRHYAYSHSSWCGNPSTNTLYRIVYTKCVNCGGDRGQYKEYKKVDSSYWKNLDQEAQRWSS